MVMHCEIIPNSETVNNELDFNSLSCQSLCLGWVPELWLNYCSTVHPAHLNTEDFGTDLSFYLADLASCNFILLNNMKFM